MSILFLVVVVLCHAVEDLRFAGNVSGTFDPDNPVVVVKLLTSVEAGLSLSAQYDGFVFQRL